MAGQWTLYHTSSEVDPGFKPFADSPTPQNRIFLDTAPIIV
jgi:hypothetical protein